MQLRTRAGNSSYQKIILTIASNPMTKNLKNKLINKRKIHSLEYVSSSYSKTKNYDFRSLNDVFYLCRYLNVLDGNNGFL